MPLYNFNIIFYFKNQIKEFMKKLEKAEPKKLEPSMFQQMINQVVVNQDSDEEEEENEENDEEPQPAENKQGAKDNLDKLD